MNWNAMIKSKTFWLGLAGVATGIGLVVNGETDQGIKAIGAGLALIFVRDAIAKNGT